MKNMEDRITPFISWKEELSWHDNVCEMKLVVVLTLINYGVLVEGEIGQHMWRVGIQR